jgi:hypothetical protein
LSPWPAAPSTPATEHEVPLLAERHGTSGGPRERLWRVRLEDAPGSPQQGW